MAADDSGETFVRTRDRLLVLLCHAPRTVNELMAELGVTDNAVRAQLANLQESELVRPVGLRPGTRKPHVEYELTPKARRMFPLAHEQVLGVLAGVLHERMPPAEVSGLVREVARRIFGRSVGELRAAAPRGRLAEVLRRIGGPAAGVSLGEEGGRAVVRACGCPLANVTADHPGVCAALAEVLGDVLGTTVRERCDRSEWPRCCFEVEMEGKG